MRSAENFISNGDYFDHNGIDIESYNKIDECTEEDYASMDANMVVSEIVNVICLKNINEKIQQELSEWRNGLQLNLIIKCLKENYWS